MPNPRKRLSELELVGSTNLKRSLGYKAQPSLGAAERADLVELYESLKARREALLAEIEEHGLVLVEDRFQRNQLYQRRVANPAVAMLASVERQIVSVVKILAATIEEKPTTEMTTEELLAKTDELLRN